MSVYLVFYGKWVAGSFKDYASAEAAVLKYIGNDPHTVKGEVYTATHRYESRMIRYTLEIIGMKMGSLNLTLNKSALM